MFEQGMNLQLFASNLGVYPVFDLRFKVGTNGSTSVEDDMKVVAEMETFSVSVDGNVEEWTPMNTEGWARRLMTGKSFTVSLNGKRHQGDPGNDYVAGVAWKKGLDCSTKGEIEFPNGDKLTFDCVLNVTSPFGGDSINVSGLEFEMQSDGKPVYVPAANALEELTFICEAGLASGTQIAAVVPVLTAGSSYMYKINGALPAYGEDVTGKGWATYTLGEDIPVTAGNTIALIEATVANLARKGGKAPVVVA